jgi:amino acid permease
MSMQQQNAQALIPKSGDSTMSSQGNLSRPLPVGDGTSAAGYEQAGEGRFKKQLSLTDLTFIGLGAIFGSGWLFAASHVSAIAGPAGILSS